MTGLLNGTFPNGSIPNIDIAGMQDAIQDMSKEIMAQMKKGAFKGNLPNMDFTNITNVEAMLNEFSEENFNLDDNFMIPDLKNLTQTAPCVKRLEDIFEIMSTAEQVAFFGAYKAAQKNKTAE